MHTVEHTISVWFDRKPFQSKLGEAGCKHKSIRYLSQNNIDTVFVQYRVVLVTYVGFRGVALILFLF